MAVRVSESEWARMKHVLQRIANGTRIRNQGQRAMTAAELTTLARELCGRRGWEDYYDVTGTEAEDLLWARGTGPRRPRKKRQLEPETADARH